ncbi:MAG: hypothetical protein MAG795_01204 [Candidatus Woesearchaeota archaeon]|nr:hypothetical protein [Candidatus Woesearchaeota archaeon]
MKQEDVFEWVKNYIKFVNAYHKKMKEMLEEKGVIIVKYKSDKVEHYYPIVNLEDVDFSGLKSNPIIVAINSKHNFKTLVNDWEEISKNPDLKLIFFNQESSLQRKWVIKPYVHNRICNKKSLKKGLKSMFETVDIVG